VDGERASEEDGTMTALAAAPLLCAGPQALVGGGVLAALTVGALVYGMSSSSGEIDSASGAADDDLAGTTTTPCTGECECGPLSQQIESQAIVLQRRLDDMVLDQNDLYNTARGLADNWGSGTWQGHIDRFNDERNQLRGNIALADSKGCPVSDFAREIANESAPLKPGY
jgi:hypothetical protein